MKKNYDLSLLSGTVSPKRDLWPVIQKELLNRSAGKHRNRNHYVITAAAVLILSIGAFIGFFLGNNTVPRDGDYLERIVRMEKEYQRLKPVVLKTAEDNRSIPRNTLKQLVTELNRLDRPTRSMILALEEYEGSPAHYTSVLKYYKKKFEMIKTIRNLSLPLPETEGKFPN